jgi:hypothetical protein
MKFLVFDEDWIVDGSILYDSPEEIEVVSVGELIKKLTVSTLDGEPALMEGFELTNIETVDENELIVEFLMPFAFTHQYHFIEEEEAKKRRLDNSLSEPE